MRSVLFSIITLAAAVLAAPSANAPRACTYEKGSYVSVCQQGQNLFCTGDKNICPSGKKESIDTQATSANEAACVGKKRGDGCTITVACC